MPHHKRGTPEWLQEQEESKKSVERFFEDTVGPYDPNAPKTIRTYINPNSGLLTQIPPEDQRPIPDDTGLFQKHK